MHGESDGREPAATPEKAEGCKTADFPERSKRISRIAVAAQY
jgi:hypothetical protein